MSRQTTDKMPAECKALYSGSRKSHEDLYRLSQVINGAIPAADLETLCNIAHALRQSNKYIEDLRKTLTAIERFAERLACMRYIQDGDNEKQANVKTEYVTATPDVTYCASIPTLERDAEAYHSLMSYLGIDPVLRDQGIIQNEDGTRDYTEVIKVHWPGFQSLMNRLAAAGIALPDGIDPEKTYTEYKLRLRSRKEIGEATGATENPF